MEDEEYEKQPQMTPHVTAIRDALVAIIPQDPNIVSNVQIHDGLADISVRWRSLRFASCEAIGRRDADEIALVIDERFRAWLRGTIQNMKDVPKHSRVAADMARWLKANPDKREWLYGKQARPEEAAADTPLPQREVTS